MTNKEYANNLIKNLGVEKAFAVATASKAASERQPNTYMADEAAFYVDQQGLLQLAKDQSKFAGKREKRMKSLSNFWTEVYNIIKKEVK